MKRNINYVITPNELPADVGGFLRKTVRLTRNQISQLKFKEGGICVNDIPARVNQKLQVGDQISICLESEAEGSRHLDGVPGEVDIRYEDEDILLVNKKAGVPVHPSHGHYSDTLANHLVYHYRMKGQEICVRPVGRLDKETSGMVLFAKNQVAAARLTKSRKNAVYKEYLALVKECPGLRKSVIDSPLKAAEGHLNRMVVDEGGKPAITHYEVERRYETCSLVRLHLETGRTHQIRVHMASIGHPLLGDQIYGAETSVHGLTRAALHCEKICLTQPITGRKISVTAPLPEDMGRIVNDGTIEL